MTVRVWLAGTGLQAHAHPPQADAKLYVHAPECVGWCDLELCLMVVRAQGRSMGCAGRASMRGSFECSTQSFWQSRASV